MAYPPPHYQAEYPQTPNFDGFKEELGELPPAQPEQVATSVASYMVCLYIYTG